MHGHSYVLLVTVERTVDRESGMAIDFSDLKQVVRTEVVERMDHRCINDLMETPTAEHMAEWIWNALVEGLPGLAEIELHETVDCSVIYRGP
jgi:6-pyruvoyltetrahydropterin/6-carboxytetrahydropterin synthase